MTSYAKNPSPDRPLDAGRYVDIYENTAELSIKDKSINSLKADEQDLYQSEQQSLGEALALICGIDAETTLTEDGEYWTEESALDAINETRAFLHTELKTVLNLKGVMGEILGSLFFAELLVRSDSELESYAALFRLNTSGLNPEAPNYREELESLVIEFNFWVLERLRWWQWRDEVLFGKASIEYKEYPGISMTEFENSEQIFRNGYTFYYPRIGSVTVEFLLEKFHYFDLCHMAGVLALMSPKEFILTTDAEPEFVVDIIISLIEHYPEIDPRSFLTPLGPRKVHNKEEGEYIHNFNPYNKLNNSIDEMRPSLARAAYDSGVSIYICHDENELLDDSVEEKPTCYLAEEIMAQYMSPQFWTGVEGHRNYLSALKTYKSLSGTPITVFKNYEIILYGIGNGTSSYQFYTWRDLYEVFYANQDFVDPFSVIKRPEEPKSWSRFSKQSIRRLQRVIIPMVIDKTTKYPALNQTVIKLNELITELVDKNLKEETNYRVAYQKSLINALKKEIRPSPGLEDFNEKMEVSRKLVDYFTNVYNIGMQFSDWNENFADVPEKQAQYYQEQNIGERGLLLFLPSEYYYDLYDKITRMLTHEISMYENVLTKNGNLKTVLRELRIVRLFGDRYCTAYEDELESISGRIYLMLEALSCGYREFLKSSGNWLMTTAKFYLDTIFEDEAFSKSITIDY